MTFDRQKAFDTALAGLRAQGRKSASEFGTCFYRSPDGLKCAVGFLMPDDKYNPILEGRWAGHLRVRQAIGAALKDGDFLSEMQACLHDDQWHDLRHLEDDALGFAARWKLSYTAPENAQ